MTQRITKIEMRIKRLQERIRKVERCCLDIDNRTKNRCDQIGFVCYDVFCDDDDVVRGERGTK